MCEPTAIGTLLLCVTTVSVRDERAAKASSFHCFLTSCVILHSSNEKCFFHDFWVFPFWLEKMSIPFDQVFCMIALLSPAACCGEEVQQHCPFSLSHQLPGCVFCSQASPFLFCFVMTQNFGFSVFTVILSIAAFFVHESSCFSELFCKNVFQQLTIQLREKENRCQGGSARLDGHSSTTEHFKIINFCSVSPRVPTWNVALTLCSPISLSYEPLTLITYPFITNR